MRGQSVDPIALADKERADVHLAVPPHVLCRVSPRATEEDIDVVWEVAEFHSRDARAVGLFRSKESALKKAQERKTYWENYHGPPYAEHAANWVRIRLDTVTGEEVWENGYDDQVGVFRKPLRIQP